MRQSTRTFFIYLLKENIKI